MASMATPTLTNPKNKPFLRPENGEHTSLFSGFFSSGLALFRSPIPLLNA